MKLWKNLTVVAVALLLISAITAAQFMAVTGDSLGLEVDTKQANLQFIAGDACVVEEDEYMLKYDEAAGSFELELGTWGIQNEFRASAAFGIVNAGALPVEITAVTVEDSEGDGDNQFENAVDMYFHWDQHERDPEMDEMEEIPLNTPDEHTTGNNDINDVQLDAGYGYEDETTLYIGTDAEEDVDAVWDADENVWYTGSEEDFSETNEQVTNENAVWVYVIVDPEVEDGTTWEDGDLSLSFEVEEIG